MSSLVFELQRECLEAQSTLPNLLRKALVIARKLKVAELDCWIENELGGYQGTSNVPPYRIVTTRVKVQDRWGQWEPMTFRDSESEHMVTKVPIFDSVAQIEGLLHHAGQVIDGSLAIPFSSEQARILMGGSEAHLTPMRFARVEDLSGILDTVRTELLTWCLRLEEDGIVGEGMTFSKEEQQKAAAAKHTTHYHIGTMTNSQIQHGSDHISASLTVGKASCEDVERFIAVLKRNLPLLGIKDEQRLASDIRLLETRLKAPHSDQSLLREALISVKTTLEGAAGSLVASGLLYELGKILS